MTTQARSTITNGSRTSLRLMSCRSVMAACLLLTRISSGQEGEPGVNSRDGQIDSSLEAPAQQYSPQNFEKKKNSSYAKVSRYADYLFSKYDLNRDGSLQYEEWKNMHGHPELIAAYGDGVISREQLRNWISDYSRRRRTGTSSDHELSHEKPTSSSSQSTKRAPHPSSLDSNDSAQSASTQKDDQPNSESQNVNAPESSQPVNSDRRRDQKFYVPPKRLPDGLPDWFFERDKDGDGQLTVSEFCISGGNAEMAEFKKLDANGDGVITAKECTRKVTDKSTAAKPTTDGLPDPSAEKKETRSRRKPRSSQKNEP